MKFGSRGFNSISIDKASLSCKAGDNEKWN